MTKDNSKDSKYRFRLAVFRSARSIYAQIIDDRAGKTLAAASEKDLKKTSGAKKETKTARAGLVGEALAAAAQKKKIKRVFFDRRRFKYHGRVKALAEGARKGGLEF